MKQVESKWKIANKAANAMKKNLIIESNDILREKCKTIVNVAFAFLRIRCAKTCLQLTASCYFNNSIM